MPFNPDNWQGFQPSGGAGYGSPQYNWEYGNAWGSAGEPYNWQAGGFDPTNPFGTTYYQPGSDPFQMTPAMQHWQDMQQQTWQNDMSTAQNNYIAGEGWVAPGQYKGIDINGNRFLQMDPSGNLQFDVEGSFGGGGGGGGYGVSEWGGGPAYGGSNVTAPGQHTVNDYSQSMIDVTDLIDAESRLSDIRREDAWADAASRFGQSGMVASTPYMNKLGDVAAEEEARKDQIFGQLRYQSGTDFANRQLQEEMQQRALEEQAWATHGGWDMGAQMANAQNDLSAWQTQYGGDFGAWQAQNDWGMQNYWNQQNMNQNQLGQVMGMIGGIL